MKKLAGRRRRRTRNEGDEMKRGRERRDRHGIRILNHSRPPAAPLSLFLPFSLNGFLLRRWFFHPITLFFSLCPESGMNVPVRADPLPSWEEYQNRCSLGFASVVPTPWARDVAELHGHNTPVLYHIRIASSCVVRFQSIMCCVEYLVIQRCRRLRCRRRSNSLTQVLVNLA